MSMINRQIEWLKELSMADMSFYKDEDYRKACKEAANTISVLSEKLQAANMERSTAYYNGGWIPISKRLPELNELDTKVWKQTVIITGYLSFDDKKELFVSEASINDVINNSVHNTVVTAWMPLPAPFEPQGSEG